MSKKMSDAYVFIDAKYLQLIGNEFKEKKLFLGGYCINQFAITMAKNKYNWCKKVFYYTAPPFQGTPPLEDQIRRRSNYNKFINALRRIPSFYVEEGRCQKVDGKFHQKGVDTLLTMGLMKTALTNKNTTIILLACDTDFVPILNSIREEYGVKVILYFYNDYVRGSKFSMSNKILTACDESVLITKELFEKSLRKKKEV